MTGLRRGDITGLRCADVDLAAPQGGCEAKPGHRQRPCPGAEPSQTYLRAMAPSDFAVATLLAWQLRQAEEAEAAAEE
jgi:hypothetical protein